MPEDTNEILNALDDRDPGDETGTGDGAGDGNIAAVADESGAGSGAGAAKVPIRNTSRVSGGAEGLENVQPAKVEEPIKPLFSIRLATDLLIDATDTLRKCLPNKSGEAPHLPADQEYVIPKTTPVQAMGREECEAEIATLADPMTPMYATGRLREAWAKAHEELVRELDRASVVISQAVQDAAAVGNGGLTRINELKGRIKAIDAEIERERKRLEREEAERGEAEAAAAVAERARKEAELAARG